MWDMLHDVMPPGGSRTDSVLGCEVTLSSLGGLIVSPGRAGALPSANPRPSSLYGVLQSFRSSCSGQETRHGVLWLWSRPGLPAGAGFPSGQPL